MTSTSFTYGSLALTLDRPSTPALSVVSGGVSTVSHIQPGHFQVAAPDVYARDRPAPSSRSRFVLFGVASLVLIVACASILSTVFQARNASHAAFVDTLTSKNVTVSAGESLWSIAEDNPVDGLAIEEAVEVMRDWNGLTSASLHPGMELVVPSAG